MPRGSDSSLEGSESIKKVKTSQPLDLQSIGIRWLRLSFWQQYCIGLNVTRHIFTVWRALWIWWANSNFGNCFRGGRRNFTGRLVGRCSGGGDGWWVVSFCWRNYTNGSCWVINSSSGTAAFFINTRNFISRRLRIFWEFPREKQHKRKRNTGGTFKLKPEEGGRKERRRSYR